MLFAVNRLPLAIDALMPACDIFHASTLLRRPPHRKKLSTTIHDMTPWITPQFHRTTQIAADIAFAENFLKRADGVIADSENSRRDAIRILGLAPDRVRVIYPGVPGDYFSVGHPQVSDARHHCRLKRPYFLFVGSVEPRKNIDTLLDAWLSLPADFRQENELIAAGMPGWKADKTFLRLTNLEPESVRYLGYVPEARMPGLIAGAEALLFPSHYEGFGFPVAQAMAAGCPVITSNVSSLPEIAGDAALLIDPRSAGEIATAIARIGDSPSLRESLRAKGRERAQSFTWPRAAEQSFRYFESLCG